jgi:hypothetical protein
VEGNRDPDSQPGSEEAAWRELIAQFDAPEGEPSAIAPWPSAEDLPAAGDRMPGQDTMPDWELATRSGTDADAGGSTDIDQFGNVPARAADQPARLIRPSGSTWRTPQVDYDPDEADRYVPEPLPPPGQLDPVSKAAWAAVICGPLYLLIGWMLGWAISGFGALLAIAATVGGFVILVLKLGDRPSRSDDDDNGAVL